MKSTKFIRTDLVQKNIKLYIHLNIFNIEYYPMIDYIVAQSL